MESIDYFYGLTNLNSGIIRSLNRYPAATGGNFLGNSGSNSVTWPISGNNYENFSLFLTYDKKQSNFNRRGVKLFSNSSGTGGFTFGLDQNNFPFLKTSNQSLSFDEITLGGKNTICLQKSDNIFSIFHYDVPSADIVETQSVFLNPTSPLSGGNYLLGGGEAISGVNNFYGTFDQWMFLSEKVSRQNALTIFSGFSNLGVSQSVFGNYVVSSYDWVLPAPINSSFQSGLQNYFTGIYQGLVLDEALAENQNYIGKIEFDFNGGGYDVVNSYGFDTAHQFCKTGTYFQMGDAEEFSSFSGAPSNFDVYVNFSIGPYDLNYSAFQPREMYFTYNISEVSPGLRFSDLMQLKLGETIVQTANTGYFKGYEMKGVVVPKAKLALLGKLPGRFNQVGNEAVFDSNSSLFYAESIPSGSQIFLNGLGVSPSGYTFNSGVINVLNYAESSSDNIIYDQVSGVTPITLSNTSSPTGDYYWGAGFVASGEYSFGTLYRISESQFLQTHPYNLIHNRNWQQGDSPQIFNNSDQYWF